MILAVATACAAPIGITRTSTSAVYESLSANALSTERPSPFSRQLLSRLGLGTRFADDPVGTLAMLHARLSERSSPELRFVLAELSLLHADQHPDVPDRSAHYLAAVVYAYAYLFPRTAGPAEASGFDPRFRLACDLYNAALSRALLDRNRGEVAVSAGGYPLPFGRVTIHVEPSQLEWGGYRLERFVAADDFEVRGLRNRYRRPGLGAPLAATPGARTGTGVTRVSDKTKVPVTLLLRLENVETGLRTGDLQGWFELHTLDAAPSVAIDGQAVPLETDITAALAYGIEGSRIWEFGVPAFFGRFTPVAASSGDGLFFTAPHRPGRIPLVLVHGTFSSPAPWAELLNELMADPAIERRYQFWLFVYRSGYPITTSAAMLREALLHAVAELDPDGRDPALREMVVVGHSQGGLLCKMLVVESGDHLWRLLSDVPLETIDLSADTKAEIRRALVFQPLPFVKRVIFLATPHRGTTLASVQLRRLIRRLMLFPADVARLGTRLFAELSTNPAIKAEARLADILTSIDYMSPSNRTLRVLASLPLAPGVAAHSIIAVRGEGTAEEGDDGVVAYASAHVDGVASEKIVRSGHSLQAQPETIEEIRRILTEHLRQMR